jgi:hypothetical protein
LPRRRNPQERITAQFLLAPELVTFIATQSIHSRPRVSGSDIVAAIIEREKQRVERTTAKATAKA